MTTSAGTPLSLARGTLVYCNNDNIVYLSTNLVQYQQTKHVETDLHFFRELVVVGDVLVLHIKITSQFVAIFTKDLPTSVVFAKFISNHNVG